MPSAGRSLQWLDWQPRRLPAPVILGSIGGIATLNSVAAIVLGGIALTGGVGSVIAAVAAGVILFFLNPILTAMGVDPNTAQVIQGVLIVVVMALAGLSPCRNTARASYPTTCSTGLMPALSASSISLDLI